MTVKNRFYKKINHSVYSIDYALIALLLLLFIFPNICIQAAKNGLLLWFNVIIPTLFPFILISNVIAKTSIIDKISKFLSPIALKLFHLPGYGTYAFIMGSLSGYPMGAKVIHDLLEQKKISSAEGNYLLMFCNNCSPMFIIGYICSSLLKRKEMIIPMLIGIYLGNLLTILLLNPKKHKKTETLINPIKIQNRPHISFSFFDDCIGKTAELLVKIGGYIIFFSIPITILSSLPIKNIVYQFAISLIELSNGCNLINNLSCDLSLKFSFLCALSAFGSFSVIGQTASIIQNSLSMKTYIFSKSINTAITFITAFFIYTLFDFFN